MDRRIICSVSLLCVFLPSCRVLNQRVDLSWFRDTMTAPQNDTVYVESGQGLPASAAPIEAVAQTSVAQMPTVTPQQSIAVRPASPTPAQPTVGSLAARPAGRMYTVAKGDTLAAIARRHHSTVPSICAANGITNPNHLQLGAKLIIPDGTGHAPASPSAAPTPIAAPTTSMRPTATSVKAEKPRTARRKEASSGWRIWPFRKKAPATPQSSTYTVQPGDTLNAVARRHGITPTALMNANGISREQADRLSIGQRLVIPTSSK